MTHQDLMTHEVTHRYSGNGFAVVAICGPVKEFYGTSEYVRVTDRWCKSKQAFLAAVDHLTISKQFKGTDPDGVPYPPEPIILDADDLSRLTPLREGLADGSLKIVSTRFVKQPTAATV